MKFDYVVLANHGITMRGVEFDTMIATFLLGEGGGAGKPEEGNLGLNWLFSRASAATCRTEQRS